MEYVNKKLLSKEKSYVFPDFFFFFGHFAGRKLRGRLNGNVGL